MSLWRELLSCGASLWFWKIQTWDGHWPLKKKKSMVLLFFAPDLLLDDPVFPLRPISRMCGNMVPVICFRDPGRGRRSTRWTNLVWLIIVYLPLIIIIYYQAKDNRGSLTSKELLAAGKLGVVLCFCFFLVTLLRTAQVFVVGEKKIRQTGRQTRDRCNCICFHI